MINKQIIDDIDVSECKYFCLNQMGNNCLNHNRGFSMNCNNNNCYYKQFKRKQNELEELRQYHNKCCEEFKKEKQDLIDKYNQLSINFYNGDYCNTEHCSLLKAKEKECERLEQTLIQIKDIAENVQSFVGRINIEDDVFEQMEQILQKISEMNHDLAYNKVLQKIREENNVKTN